MTGMKTKRTIIIILSLTCFPTLSGALAADYTVPLRFELPVIAEEVTDFPLSVQNAPQTLLINNWPAIPYRLLLEELPPGSRVVDVIETSDTPRIIPLRKPLPFTKGLRILSQPDRVVHYDTFDFDAPYPQKPMEWRVLGGLDPLTLTHKTWLVIRVFPVQYQNASHLLFREKITVTIRTEDASAETMSLPRKQDEQETVIVIAPEIFEAVLQPYLTHKTAAGLSCSLYTIESIIDTAAGRDDAEKLRLFIRSKVEQNDTAFVLLAGDADVLPVRRCALTHDPLDQALLPMEDYFADLFNGYGDYHDWDANGDGNFGDFIDDLSAMDLVPDVFTARIPASTPEEMKAAADKIIRYETSSQPQDDWFNRVIFAAVDTFNERDHNETSGIPEGECMAEFLAETIFADRDIVRLYETDTYPHDAPAEPDDVVEKTNDGAGFMAFHCHGSPNCFWLISSCFGHDHADQLRNDYKQPVMFGFACSTAAFDNELPDWPYGSSGESMPEHFILNDQGGAIGFVGATRVALASGYSHADYRAMSGALEYHYFKSYDKGMQTPGMMLAAMKLGYLQHVGMNGYYDYYSIAQYAQFGDPVVSLGGFRQDIALQPVQALQEVEGGLPGQCIEPGCTVFLTPVLLNIGAAAPQVTAVLESNDPDVTILNADVFYGDFGRFQKLMPESAFKMTIAPNAETNKHIQLRMNLHSDDVLVGDLSIDIFIGNAPQLVLDDWDIIYDSYKNGNPDPGDHIMPSLFIRNIGCKTAENMIITVQSNSPFLDKCQINNDGELGDLPPDYCRETGWGIIELVISENCPHETDIPILAEISCDNGHKWDIPFVVTVRDKKGPRMWDYSVEPRSSLPNDTVQILTNAYDVSGIESIHAIIKDAQTGDQQVIRLHDDGNNNDGIFGAYIETGAVPSNYIVDLVSLDSRGNEFQIKEASAFSTIPIQSASVLLIDTSTDPGASEAVSQSLTNLGIDHFSWDSRYRGALNKQVLDLFHDGIVVWLFGWTNSPDESMRNLMANYLDNGGALMVSGWDMVRNASRTGGRIWLRDYFGVEAVNGDTGVYFVEGIPGNPVTEGLGFRLKRKNASLAFTPDTIKAVADGETFMRFKELPEAAGAVVTRDAGIRTVCLPFALEGIRTPGEMESFLDRILPWMADRPDRVEFDLNLSSELFFPGDPFVLSTTLLNPYRNIVDADQYIALAVGDIYWFWPSWVEFPPEVDRQPISLEPFSATHQTILDFIWPTTDVTATGILFYGVLIDPESADLLTDLKSVSFGF